MTNSEDREPRLSAEDDARVRRLLAAAGGPEATPDAVVERLDRTLAALVAERAEEPGAAAPAAASPPPPGPAPVVDLASRRQRRVAAGLVAAAAAVVVGGVGIGAILSGGDDAGDSDGAGEMENAPGDAAQEPTRDEGKAPGMAASEAPTAWIDEEVVVLDDGSLRDDLIALQDTALPHPATADYTTTTITAPRGFQCDAAAWPTGVLYGVQYQGEPAMVAFRAPAGDSQVVAVLQCGTATVLRSTTLPAPD